MLLQSSCSLHSFSSPHKKLECTDLITSNGHDATTLGDVLSSSKSNLSLVELFEKSEEGVVKIQVERDGQQ